MEHLTKQQIILLTLLVSFVSSIATGIVTVSLLEQAPPAVTQTINRVVERTIEKAVSTSTPAATRETIVVKDSEAVVMATAKVSESVVRIYGYTYESSVEEYLGLGVVVSEKGVVMGQATIAGKNRFTARFESGSSVPLSLVSSDSRGIAIFQAEQSADLRDARAYAVASLGNSENVKLGQTVIALGGAETTAVATGIISSIVRDGELQRTGAKEATRIRTTIAETALLGHSVLVNLAGEVIGFKMGSTQDDGYEPSNIAEKAYPGSL